MTRYLIFLIFVIWVGWSIYRGFWAPMNTYQDHLRRSYHYEKYLRNPGKAIEVLEAGLKESSLTQKEKIDLNLEIGLTYYKLKKYKQACEAFDRLFVQLGDQQFYYEPKLQRIVKAYIYADQKERAREVYGILMKRQSYDPNFKKLRAVEKLFSE